MTPLEHDGLLTKRQILEKETVTRPKETNQRSEAESKETKNGGVLCFEFGTIDLQVSLAKQFNAGVRSCGAEPLDWSGCTTVRIGLPDLSSTSR